MALTSQQKAQLTDNAGRRMARRTLIAQLIYPGFSALLIVGFALANLFRSHDSMQHRLIVLAVAIGFAAFLGLLVWWLYHRVRPGKQTPMVNGADADTRRAVKQALRDGHSSSPEIVELVEDQRAHWHKQRKTVWLLVPIFLLIVIGELFGSHKDLPLVAIMTILFVAMIVHWTIIYRRLNRFRSTS